MLHLVAVFALAVLGASGASAQEHGVVAIGVESARHAFSFSGEADASTCAGPPTARWWRSPMPTENRCTRERGGSDDGLKRHL